MEHEFLTKLKYACINFNDIDTWLDLPTIKSDHEIFTVVQPILKTIVGMTMCEKPASDNSSGSSRSGNSPANLNDDNNNNNSNTLFTASISSLKYLYGMGGVTLDTDKSILVEYNEAQKFLGRPIRFEHTKDVIERDQVDPDVYKYMVYGNNPLTIHAIGLIDKTIQYKFSDVTEYFKALENTCRLLSSGGHAFLFVKMVNNQIVFAFTYDRAAKTSKLSDDAESQMSTYVLLILKFLTDAAATNRFMDFDCFFMLDRSSSNLNLNLNLNSNSSSKSQTATSSILSQTISTYIPIFSPVDLNLNLNLNLVEKSTGKSLSSDELKTSSIPTIPFPSDIELMLLYNTENIVVKHTKPNTRVYWRGIADTEYRKQFVDQYVGKSNMFDVKEMSEKSNAKVYTDAEFNFVLPGESTAAWVSALLRSNTVILYVDDVTGVNESNNNNSPSAPAFWRHFMIPIDPISDTLSLHTRANFVTLTSSTPEHVERVINTLRSQPEVYNKILSNKNRLCLQYLNKIAWTNYFVSVAFFIHVTQRHNFTVDLPRDYTALVNELVAKSEEITSVAAVAPPNAAPLSTPTSTVTNLLDNIPVQSSSKKRIIQIKPRI